MKAVLIKARDNFKAGDTIECADAAEFAALYAGGFAISETEHNAKVAAQQANEASIDNAIRAQQAKGAIAPKDETVKATALRYLANGVPIADVLEIINAKSGNDTVQATNARVTTGSEPTGRIQLQGVDIRDAGSAYIQACEPQDALIRQGKYQEATELSAQAAQRFLPIVRAAAAGDLILKDAIRAADTTDGNLGTIATGLILQRNLGFLKNKLSWMPYLTTDLRNEPVKYGQPVFTRYITPPTAAAYNTTTGYARATATTTDVSVTINQHYSVEIGFQTQLLGSTARNLFAEQQGAQFYSLAEAVNKSVLATLFSATWTGTVTQLVRALDGWNLPGMVALKNAMTLSKLPDTGRFALLHSCWYDKMLEDSNMLNAKVLMALINKDQSALNGGELPPLFGVQPLESQLAAANAAGALVDITDPTNISAKMVGFAGNSASCVFAARVPNDYTQALQGVPATAAVQIATEPDSGLSIMLVKYHNHTLGQAAARCALMWGSAQGDPRQGIIIKPSAS